jgi:hypothetical protein
MREFTCDELARFLSEGMPCLSLWEAWATLIAAGYKLHETRHWWTKVRGWVAIHAAKKVDRAGSPEELCEFAFGPDWHRNRPVGNVIAVAYLSGCHRAEDVAHLVRHCDLLAGNFGDGRFAFRLDCVRPLRAPIPLVGRQGFFRWTPPEDLLSRLLRPADHEAAADRWDDHRGAPRRVLTQPRDPATGDGLAPLRAFNLAALEAELAFGGQTEFSARMASYYCRSLMALEAVGEDA